jgi:NAD-dependent dihydropyrimidine dehydrogenase PreA subunit
MPCRHYSFVVIIEPQTRLLCTLCVLIVYPDYRATTASTALRHYSFVVIIEPQTCLLCTLCVLIVYPDYRATTATVVLVTKVCYVAIALMAAHALTPDTLERCNTLNLGYKISF